MTVKLSRSVLGTRPTPQSKTANIVLTTPFWILGAVSDVQGSYFDPRINGLLTAALALVLPVPAATRKAR